MRPAAGRSASLDLTQDSIIYSLEVDEDIIFDLSLIERYGAEVHAFDPTPPSTETLSTTDLRDRFQFHPWAITAKDGTLKFHPRVRMDHTIFAIYFHERNCMSALIRSQRLVNLPVHTQNLSNRQITLTPVLKIAATGLEKHMKQTY